MNQSTMLYDDEIQKDSDEIQLDSVMEGIQSAPTVAHLDLLFSNADDLISRMAGKDERWKVARRAALLDLVRNAKMRLQGGASAGLSAAEIAKATTRPSVAVQVPREEGDTGGPLSARQIANYTLPRPAKKADR